ncbi:hypothetical protein ACLOJK_027255, partial [Asimina triloba]
IHARRRIRPQQWQIIRSGHPSSAHPCPRISSSMCPPQWPDGPPQPSRNAATASLAPLPSCKAATASSAPLPSRKVATAVAAATLSVHWPSHKATASTPRSSHKTVSATATISSAFGRIKKRSRKANPTSRSTTRLNC